MNTPKYRALAITAAVVSISVLSSSGVRAVGTGYVKGTVCDKSTNEPLAYANAVIVGRPIGAMSLDEGQFVIGGVPAGDCTVRVMMMGYKPVEVPITVYAGETVELTFALEETIVAKTHPIDVYAKRPPVDVTASDTKQRMSGDDYRNAPLDNILEVPQFKAGVVKVEGGYSVRGGRPREVQTQIDGVLADDPLEGVPMTVGQMGTAGFEMVTGGMDAEYGNAQSAIFNITTRDGGPVFGGQFRYMTDDFGRKDRTYTNFDNVSLGFGGPTPWPSLRYYVSTEATFSDGENTTIEPRVEHKNGFFDWIKATDRMSHNLNLQTKLSWHRPTFTMTGEAIMQRSRVEQYMHNWNIEGYVQKVYYFQRLVQAGTGVNVFEFGGITVHYEGPWIERVNDPSQPPNPRPVVVKKFVRDVDTGEADVVTYTNFRAVDVAGETILWDERVDDAGKVAYRSWILFEGFQRPQSRFSHFKDDSSYVFFNSSTRTPEVVTENLQLKLTLEHNVTDDLLYSIKISRLSFDRSETVSGKAPEAYESAGMPAELPDGTYLEGGITQATWYTDPDHPYFVTAYDYPFYSDRHSIQYLAKTDVTYDGLRGHRFKMGLLALYNDLNNDERFLPALRRTNADGTVQQGWNVNVFRNFNTEGAAYFQDKWEYEGMVANFGMRLDFFSTGNSDEIEINSSDINQVVDRYKFDWSPRLGFAFPITDRNKFFFHYGRFTQWPSRARLFAVQDAIGALGTLGNPNLGPELTVSYQAGVAHQFTQDLVGNFVVFYKDIYGLVATTSVTDDSTGIQSDRYINKAYASSRGLEVSLEKRLTGHIGFEVYYTYSFADGVASDADFGRSGDGLTHLPTDELPLDWDQRHTFNATVRFSDGDDWGATVMYQYASGRPWTPYDRFARLQDPTWENSRRLPATHRLRIQGRKQFTVYGQRLTFFFEGRNLLDEDILLDRGDRPQVFPAMEVAQMDNGAYLTETGQYGGAYMQDIDDDGVNDFTPVYDPTIWEPHRSWRVGFGVEF